MNANNKVLRPIWLLLCLLLFSLVGLQLFSMLRDISPSDNILHTNELVSSIVSSFLVFALPAISVSVLFEDDPLRRLGFRRPHLSRRGYLFLALSFPLCMGLVSLSSTLLELLLAYLPSDWQELIAKSGEQYEQLARQMIEKQGKNTWVSILSIAVFPALVEELFFRGSLFRIFRKISPRRIHLAVWMSAIIFGLIHFDLMGLLPRIIIGAYFAYSYHYSRSIWVPIVLHMLNNSLALCFHF